MVNELPIDLLAALRAEGREFSREAITRQKELLAPLHTERGWLAPVIVRDERYGPHGRHRLDVHAPARDGSAQECGLPVLLFVHGGGFVRGDKRDAEFPAYYDHVGGWAAAHGLLGITMTYRLAPEHRWPAGAEDVAAAVVWVREHAGEHGGDPTRIVVMGQSAGAAHVAGYLAGHGGPVESVVGGILLSGLYDPSGFADDPMRAAYYDSDAAARAAQNAIPGLVGSSVPLLLGVAELDPPVFHRQVVALLDAFSAERGVIPLLHTAPGHTHVSAIYSLGLDDVAIGEVALRFIAQVTATELEGSAP